MSLLVKTVPIVTDGSGDFSTTVRGAGLILRCIDLEVGTLTTPDLDLSDEPTGTVILSVDGVAADTRYIPTTKGTDASGAGAANVGATVTLANPSAASDDILDTTAAHGFVAGDEVRFLTLTGGSGLTVGTRYWVTSTSLASTTFRIATSKGGADIGFTTDITAGTVVRVDGYLGVLPFPVMGRIQVTVAGGGASKSGSLHLLYER